MAVFLFLNCFMSHSVLYKDRQQFSFLLASVLYFLRDVSNDYYLEIFTLVFLAVNRKPIYTHA